MQRVCVSAAHHDIEAWVDWDDAALGGWPQAYKDAVDWVVDEASPLERTPLIEVAMWPQVLVDYRRDGLIA